MSHPPAPPAPSLLRTAPNTLSDDQQRLYTTLLSTLGFPMAGAPALPPPEPLARKRGRGRKQGATKSRKPTTRDTLQIVRSAGKFGPRAIGCFIDIDDLLLDGPMMLWGTPPANLSAEQLKDYEYHKESLKKMLDRIPAFEAIIRQLYVDLTLDPMPWKMVSFELNDAFHGARQADMSGLKSMVHYLCPTASDVIYPAVSRTDKSDRGLSHPVLRYFVLPAKLARHFPVPVFKVPAADSPAAELSILKDIRKGKIKLNESPLYMALWPLGGYDRHNYHIGLFRPLFVIRILRHIWTSSSSAFTGNARRIRTDANCRTHDWFEMNPEMVAYAVSQGRTMLGKHDWADSEPGKNGYDFALLWDTVVEMFRKPGYEEWAAETLEFLRAATFDRVDSIPAEDSSESEEEREPNSDDEDEIAAQDARRLAAVDRLPTPTLFMIQDNSLPRVFIPVLVSSFLPSLDVSIQCMLLSTVSASLTSAQNSRLTWLALICILIIASVSRIRIISFDLLLNSTLGVTTLLNALASDSPHQLPG
ncbi:hypothetical protein GGX14DRAFT_396873 [Mycena pura]|uniref:Uncharacterized protein n=1 Tax=Mycena pura TaxID=153505 RepID=A0AAD6V9Q1_9AGAR|nr:hypothetical protein GGX14DRAFT_396873 [Mycena pura]